MVEYLLVLVALLGVVALLSLLLYATGQHADRSLELVASEYP